MSFMLSVVIPTYNRATHLRRVLRALETQDLAPDSFEVVVVDDGSSDDTAAVLNERFTYKLNSLRQANAGPAAARNAAIRAATGDLIVFIDDDVVPAPSLLRLHRDAQAAGSGVVIGRMSCPERARQPLWAQWETRTLEKQYASMIAGRFPATPRQFYTANASVPREALLRAGLFDERFRRAEDVELAYRLHGIGLPFRFEPAANVVHDTPRTLSAWARVAEQYGRYDIVMSANDGRSHMLRNIAEEYRYRRNPALRTIARLLAGRSAPMAAFRLAALATIRAADLLRATRIGFAACSATFNVLYWDGACREIGGRAAFWSMVDREIVLAIAADAAAAQ